MLFSNTLYLFTLASLAIQSQAGLIKRDAQPEAALEHDVGSGSSLDKRVVEADETSNALEQRAPKTKMEWLSHRENFILRELAKQIENNVYPDDLVLFIGNSGSYLFYPFDEEKWNMHSIPISKTKYYKTNAAEAVGMPNNAGLDNYWDRVLKQRLYPGKQYDRIVLVDHSSSGKSVDGFREAFVDVIKRAEEKKKISKDDSKAIRGMKMVFINVVDWRRRPGGGNEATPPKSKKIELIDTITLQGTNEGEIDVILADKDKHPRVACEYYPRRWYKTVKQCWEKDGGLENAKTQRTMIKEWNEKNGGLIGPSSTHNSPQAEGAGQ